MGERLYGVMEIEKQPVLQRLLAELGVTLWVFAGAFAGGVWYVATLVYGGKQRDAEISNLRGELEELKGTVSRQLADIRVDARTAQQAAIEGQKSLESNYQKLAQSLARVDERIALLLRMMENK